MELTVVGCSGSMSGPDSPASCYLVQAPYEGRTFSLLLDLGPGSAGALYRYLDPSTVDAIALSHLHPDHCLDLCGFFVAARYSPTAPWPGIPVFGPGDTADRMTLAYQVHAPGGGASEDGPELADFFTFRTWTEEQRIGPFRVSTATVDHPVEAYAIRIDEDELGGSLVYSGDTGPCESLVTLSRDADLLLCEAAFMDRPDLPSGVHLSGRQAAEHASRAQVGSLMLTHIPPWHDPDEVREEAEDHFDGPVLLAEVGVPWTIGDIG